MLISKIIFGVIWFSVSGCITEVAKEKESLKPEFSVRHAESYLEPLLPYRDTLSVKGAPNALWVFAPINVPHGFEIEDSVITWTPPSDTGATIKITVSAIDNVSGKTFTYSWLVYVMAANHPPKIVNHPDSMPTFLLVGDTWADTIHVKEPDGEQLSFRLEPKRDWVEFQDSLVYFRPSSQDTGWHQMKLIVRDPRSGEDTLSWDMYVALEDIQVCGFSPIALGDSWAYKFETYRHMETPQETESEIRIEIISLDNRADSSYFKVAVSQGASRVSVESFVRVGQETFFMQVDSGSGFLSSLRYSVNGLPPHFSVNCSPKYRTLPVASEGPGSFVHRVEKILFDRYNSPISLSWDFWASDIGLTYYFVKENFPGFYRQDKWQLLQFKEQPVDLKRLTPKPEESPAQ